MALSRKKWNNIIIIASIMMISILTFLDNKTKQLPDDAYPLFDESSSLIQLQLNDLWLNKSHSGWQCHPSILNCQPWAEAWSNIHLSAVEIESSKFDINQPEQVIIQILDKSQPQLWSFYPVEGLLKSPSDNWYQIPPSQREMLTPIIKAEIKSGQ